MSKQITVFGSKLCAGCEFLKRRLTEAGIKFTDASITDNLANLKAFLSYRESLPMFDEIREKGRIGIPFVVVNKDEEFFFGSDSLNLDDLK